MKFQIASAILFVAAAVSASPNTNAADTNAKKAPDYQTPPPKTPDYGKVAPKTDDCEPKMPVEYKDSKCYVDMYESHPKFNISALPPHTRISFDIGGQISRCRSMVSANFHFANPGDGVKDVSLECYTQFGCAGDVNQVIKGLTDLSIGDAIKSCRVTAPCGKKALPKKIEPKKSECKEGRNDYGEPAPVDVSGTFFAVLFELGGFVRESTTGTAQERWIDGKVGECRGLGDIPIRSVQMLKSVGAEPVAKNIVPDHLDDAVTLVYFNDFGCKGAVLGATTGEDANVRLASNPKSVRFVATGLDNKYYDIKYDGKSNKMAAASTSSASNVVASMITVAIGAALAL